MLPFAPLTADRSSLPTTQQDDTTTTACVHDSMKWAKRALSRLTDEGLVSKSMLADLLSNKTVTTSEAFAGIGSGIIGDGFVTAAAKDFLASSATKEKMAPIQFKCLHAIEWDPKCIEELQALREPPACIFQDMACVVPKRLYNQCGLAHGSPKHPDRQTLERIVLRHKAKTTAWCVQHHRECPLVTTSFHRVSSPCVQHSTFGLRQKEGDPRFKYTLFWIMYCRTLKFPVVISECVLGLGTDVFDSLLGDMYVLMRFKTCPEEVGWRVTRP